MVILTLTEDQVLKKLREWTGGRATDKQREAEHIFRTCCREFTLVEIQSQKELARLGLLENYLLAGRGFYLWVHCSQAVRESVRAGVLQFPNFFYRSEEIFSSNAPQGSMFLLIGHVVDALDKASSTDVFIDLLGKEREAARPTYTPPVQPRSQSRTQPEPEPQPRRTSDDGRVIFQDFNFKN